MVLLYKAQIAAENCKVEKGFLFRRRFISSTPAFLAYNLRQRLSPKETNGHM